MVRGRPKIWSEKMKKILENLALAITGIAATMFALLIVCAYFCEPEGQSLWQTIKLIVS